MGLCASKNDIVADKGVAMTTRPVVKGRVVTKAPSTAAKARSAQLKKKDTKGHVLSSDEPQKQEPANNAAGKAAAERYEQSQKQSTKGELGKKLAEERAKSRNTHLKETAEQRQLEKIKPLVFD